MTELQKLTGGRKPYFIDSTDGEVNGKNFFLLVVTADAQFTSLESTAAGSAATDEKTAMNILAKTIKAGATINCDGLAYFTKVNVLSGQIAAYKI